MRSENAACGGKGSSMEQWQLGEFVMTLFFHPGRAYQLFRPCWQTFE